MTSQTRLSAAGLNLGVVQRTAKNSAGSALANTIIEVFEQDTGQPARIFGNASGAPVTNPYGRSRFPNAIKTDGSGNITFYALLNRALTLRAYTAQGVLLYEDNDIQPGNYADRSDASGGGGGGGGGAEQNLFVQPDAPSAPPSTYMWVQTGMNGGSDFTIWINDGT